MEEKFTSRAGIDLFYYPNRATHSFCMSLYIKAGCIYESDQNNGITHFLEHLLFRSINGHMNGDMYKQLDKRGLYFNGATYKEFIHLYIIGAPQHFEAAADILTKAFLPLSLTASDLKTEQQRVKAEIREAEDFKSLDYFAGTFVWKDTPAKNTILGTKGNISRFSKKKMEQYRKEILRGENAFFYVTGNAEAGQMEYLRQCVDKGGAAAALSAGAKARSNCVKVPADFGKRPLEVHVKNSIYTMVQFSFDFVTAKYTAAELALLYDILFSGENSLIHQELSEKRGWIYSYSSALEKYSNIGRVYFTYEIGKKELAPSVGVVAESLCALTEEKVLAEKLQYVLPEYVDNGYMIYDDNEGFNWQRAYEGHIMESGIKSLDESRAAYQAVTPERLAEIAGEIFSLSGLVLSVKGKKAQVDTGAIEKILQEYADHAAGKGAAV